MENLPSYPGTARSARTLAESARLPIVSGKVSAGILVACLVLTAVLIIPLARRFPPWIDFEIVLAGWWLVWVVALAILLYRGSRISDDHALRGPRDWLAPFRKHGPSQDQLTDWSWLLAQAGPEGCLIVLGIILSLVIALAGMWFLIELVIPALAFFAYFLVRGMLAQVTNDKHGCQGSLVQATLWGALWATIYTVPFAVVVWLVHFVHLKPGPVVQ